MTHEHTLETPYKVKGDGPKTSASMQLAVVVLAFALAALAFALVGHAAERNNRNQQIDDNEMPKITVEADHVVQKRQVGRTYTGIPIEEVSLTRHVGFRDLDLNSPSGRAELDKRINDVAKEACKQLQQLYPLEQWETDTDTCIANAVKNAKAQEQAIVASYQRK
jgi:UrcA family protein